MSPILHSSCVTYGYILLVLNTHRYHEIPIKIQQYIGNHHSGYAKMMLVAEMNPTSEYNPANVVIVLTANPIVNTAIVPSPT